LKITVLGASSGFGREFVKLLVSDENHITAVSNDEKGLQALLKSVEGNIEIACRDLTDETDSNYICEHYTDCDFMINSAGGGKLGNITSRSLEEEQYYLNLNMSAFHKITKTTLLKMIDKRKGKMLNVCSTASFTPAPNFSIYAATKAFAGSYTIALAKEVEKYGIHVMALCPGPTRTEFLSKEHYDAIQKKYLGLPIFMTPQKVAKQALKQFEKGKVFYINGWLNKLIYMSDKFLTRKLVSNAIYKIYDGLEDLNKSDCEEVRHHAKERGNKSK
jgi:short-subunit dehydrogenase